VVTPAANLSGLVDITLTVADADGGTAPATFQVTVNAVNDAPTITAVADQNINEDGQTAALNFTIGDVDTPGALTVTASSSNTVLVNGAGITLTGTGSSRTVRVTPLANAFGSTTITLRVGDGTDFTEKTFQVVVNSVDDAPSITGISPQSINENSQTGPLAFTIGDVETLPSLLTLIPASSNLALVDNTDVVFGGSGSLRSVNVKPKLNQFGTATITLTVSDGAQSAETNFLLTVASVDAPPTITAIGDFTINEDVASSAMPFTVGDPDTPLANLNVAGVSDNTALISNANISLVPGAPGDYTVQVTPSANASGVANITLTVTDDAAETITTTFQVTVTAVNDLPTMSTIANKITNEDTPAAAFNVTVGDVETAAAALVVTGVSSNSTLIPDANIAVSGTGATRSIIVTPAADQNGVSTITLTVNDGTGGTFSRAFSVTVDPVNDAPTITAISNQTITEDQAGGTGLIDFTVDDVDGNALTVTANSDDLTLVPLINIVLAGSGSARTVRVSPAANQFGTANVTLTVSDGTLNGTTSFTVTVTSVNDAPTISAVANQNIDEGTSTGALSFTVGDIETAPGSLIVNSTSSNTTLVPNANVVLAGSGAARTVTVTPAPGENGASTITLTVNDGTTTGQTTFVVTVASVDDPPTITAIGSQSTNEDTPSGAIAFTIGDPDTALGSLTLAGSSANTILIPNGNIVFGGTGASRTVTITPDANQNGSSTITITVSDASTNVATSFSLTVVSVNDTPTITVIGDQVTNEDTPSSDISFTVGDQETAAGSLTITTVSDNTALIPNANIALGGAGAARTVKMTPAANASGVANITVTVSDGVATASRTFKLTVSDVNDAPTISAIADQNIAEDTNTGAISITIGDVETPPASLILSQSSSNTTLFPLANIVLGGSGASRTVTVTPAANQNGTATISIIVDDGTTTTTRDFQVVVTPVNDSPAISGISNRTINEDEDTGNITFTISDPDDLVATLSLSGSSSDTDIVPDANITFTGTTGTRTIKVVPAPNKNGVVTITVSLSDGVNTKTRTFTVTITPINDLPVITAQQPLTINEGEQLLLTLSQLTVVDPDNTPAQLTLYVTGGPDYSISGANTITPNPAFHGNLSVPVFVGDGTGFSTPYNMVIAVNSTNDPPVIAAQSPLVTDEDQTITLQPSNFTITDLDGDMNFTLILSPGANYTFTGTTVTPAANYNGVIFVGVRANDGQASSVAVYNTQITINPVNDAPTVTGQATLSTSEETPLTLLIGNFIVTDPEPTSYTLSVLPPAPGSNYTLTGNTITPDLNYFGTLTVPITVSDGFANSAVYNTTVTVTDVNDPPVINSQNSLSTVEDIPIALDLSNFNVTDVDDPNYPASFSLTVLAGTNYTYAGTTITPTLDFSGTLNINVQIRDPRGANSATFVANLTVTKAADAPNISGQKTVSVLEEDSRIIILDDLIYTDTDTPPEDLQLIVSPGANYTVTGNTITPDANFFGTLTVGVKLFDGEANSNVWPLLVTVDNVNDPPSFNAISNLTILEDAAIQTVTITGISAGPNEGTELLNFTYVSDNTNLIKSSGILESPTYNHLAPNNTITFKPEANQFGTANITVNLIDGSGTIFPYVFAVTVTSVNDAPTLTAIPATIIPEDANEQIIILTGLSPGGGTPEADQSLTFVVSADNQIFETLLIEPTTVTGSSTASLKIKPKPNANGPSNITIRVVDNGESAPPNVNFFIRTFSMSVTPVNDAPNVTSIPSTQAQPGVAYEYQIQATDADGDIITITSPGLPAWLTLTQVSNGKATITGTPPLGTTGDVKINLAVTDPSGPAQDLGYTITVNSPPLVSNISLTTEEDIPSLALKTADFQTGFTDPDGNQLNEITIMMLPKHGDLFKAGNVPVAIGETFSGTDISTLTYKPLADYDKRDTIQWNGADGYHLYSLLPAYVFIIMTPVNDAPRITYIEPVADTLKYRLGSEELVLLTPKFDAMDPEEDDIVSAEIAFKTIDNFDYTTLHDYLVFDKTSKIDGTFSAASGTLKLTGKATAAEYVAAIRKIRYQYIDAKELELDLRSVTITLSDGKSSEPKSRIIEPIYNFEDLHIPTAFTPNEDTVNESWEITSPSGTLFLYADAEIKVYNKHGVLLWQTKGFDEHWNGVYDGSLLPSDTYFYTIDLNFNKVRYKGTVTILR
ncbi:MAG: tandem-95 repeat protein, partial [Chryseolinea sp.]